MSNFEKTLFMPAYVIVNIDVFDPEGYLKYKDIATPTVPLYGGRYIVRGGENGILEGDWQPKRVVVLEFPTLERAKAWWNSPEYTPAKEIRQRTAHTQMIFVEGV
jgi:uncharacterized protein (DUF1330 family)